MNGLLTRTSSLTDLDEQLIHMLHLLGDAAVLRDKGAQGIEVVQRHQNDVSWTDTQRNLVLEGHGHQVIQLKQDIVSSIVKIKI